MDDRIIEQLNDRQREAVFETEGYVRVIAGAGSGKTKLLVSRYAYLVQEYGIDTANILCVTFTERCECLEWRERYDKLKDIVYSDIRMMKV
ncbi:MAG: UvrD-helicase domain-containing protein [Lachnospiraceae bacterium]|nr:UvrD-helicase domain-containing protein [Lachnospiraceae bacterium]